MSRLTLAVSLFAVLVAAPSAVPAAPSAPCLGSDPAAAGDAAALAAVRAAVDAACPCASFDYTPGKRHINYLVCALHTVNAAVRAQTLRRECKRIAMYPFSRSTCGHRPNSRRPCVITSSRGVVSCKILPDRFCKGPQAAACDFYQNCLDAADTNHDGQVGAADSGACNAPPPCWNRPDGATCDAGIDARPPLTCSGGTCGVCVPAGMCSTTARACAFDDQCPSGETCTLGPTPAPRYVDNGDGTVTDRQTCMVWEKKGQYDNAPVACPGGATCSDPHDADNVYTWTSSGSSTPDGSAFTLFLDGLNSTAFAGHSDWRLPVESALESSNTGLRGLAELESIVDTGAAGCGSGPPCTPAAFDTNCSPGCSPTDPTCSCTAAGGYWTATPGHYVNTAWLVGFDDGQAATGNSRDTASARAARGGMPYQNCEEQQTYNRNLASNLLQQDGCYPQCFITYSDPNDAFSCAAGCNDAVAAFSAPAYGRCTADRGLACDALYDQAYQDSCPALAQQYCTDACQGVYNPTICYDNCTTVTGHCDELVPAARAYCEATNPVNQ